MANGEYKIFWGEAHHNSYPHSVQNPPLTDLLAMASEYLDFYTAAYYTPAYTLVPVKDGVDRKTTAVTREYTDAGSGKIAWHGVHVERFKDPQKIVAEWQEVQQATAQWNRPGSFVAFPGYEWQGDGRWGDHNVTYKTEGHPIFTVETIDELYGKLAGLDAIAIPHHTAYLAGRRAPLWAHCNDRISPYAELYSVHGCSETDEEWIGMRTNSNMGPGAGAGTYQAALDRGLHLGAICSTDNLISIPGLWGHGLMACLAEDLSRDSLWEAFLARRVYGVTGDRIELSFTLNGQPMGSILPHAPERNIEIAVRGSDAIDRIEILKNGRVIATHCHQGTWTQPTSTSRYKIRIEPGWGPRLGEVPMEDRHWKGTLHIAGGRMVAWEPCWTSTGQTAPKLSRDSADFAMVSRQEYITRPSQGATIFEFEADPQAELSLKLNGLEAKDTVDRFAASSRILWYKEDCKKLIRDTTGVELTDTERNDVYYALACKAKIHRAVPQAAFTATFNFTDDEPLDKETNYRVRVEQRNAQRAWSSPIWVGPPDACRP